MKNLYLVFQELRYRKLNFLLMVVAIATAVGFTVNALMTIQQHRATTQASVAALDDEIRKITKAMGFNINILPADLDLSQFYSDDFAKQTMPFEYVQRLADSELVTSLNHLRPALIQKVNWQERDRQIIVMGVAGVIPWTHRKNPKKPLSEAVPADSIHVGYLLAKQLNLKKGDAIVLNGETFTLEKIYPARGTQDDITVWIDLVRAQKMVDLPDRINLIQALECNCAAPDRLAQIEGEISQVLGADVQVIELSSKAIARAKARNQVAAEGKKTLQRLQRNSSTQIVVITIVVSLLVGILSWLNVRERRFEIGVFRAVGASTVKILSLFLSRAVFIGIVGAAAGCVAGYLVTVVLAETGLSLSKGQPLLFLAMMVVAPLVCAIASWFPAILAASQDTARVLAEE